MTQQWKLVPVEPTDEMETAAEDDYEQTGATFPRWKSAYAAMLAAVPTPPASAQDDAKGERQPLFWYRPRSDDGYEGPIHNDRIEDVRKRSGAWAPLYPGFATLPKPLYDLRYHGEFIRGWNQCLREVSASVAAPPAGDTPALLDHPLLRDALGYIEDAGPADVWGAAQSWMALRDAAIAGAAAGDARDAVDWYERRRELEVGMIFRTANGVVQLDSPVPGDATKWYVLDWSGDGWSAYDDTIEPGDLIGAPVANYPIAIELARLASQQQGDAA